MIPSVTHATWAKLIRGELKHQFSQAAASMLFFNLQTEYKKHPNSLPALILKSRAFFEKYERTLGPDIKQLFG